MKTSNIFLFAAAPFSAASWQLIRGPRDSHGNSKYQRAGSKNLPECQDFRHESLNRPAKDPAPGWLGCCFHIYGVNTGSSFINHNCRRLEGGERHVNEFCDEKSHLIHLKANEGIGSYKIVGRKRK
jgi:hypothetical protein